MIRRPLRLLGLLAIHACLDTTTQPVVSGGTVVIATTTDADIMFPPLVTRTVARQVTELVYDYLAEVGPSLNTVDDKMFAPRLAESWIWSSDSLSLAVLVRAAARWHDGRSVRAEDVTYTYNTYVNQELGSGMASQLSSIDSVTSTDSLTVVFWFRKRYPLQFYDAMSQMQIVPKHIFSRVPLDSLREAAAKITPVGSGRYRFVSWKRGESIELAADTANYRGAPKIDRLVWRIFQSQDPAARALLAGEVDVFDVLRPENVKEIGTDREVKALISPGADYAFMTFNLRHREDQNKPHHIFASRVLRQALTMAVDREAMTRNILDSLARPAAGPTISSFVPKGVVLDQIPYDPARAAEILDSLGWRVDVRTRTRSKNGTALRFKILVPSTSLNRMRMAVLLQEAFRKIGVAAELDQMEFATFQGRLAGREFDAALHSWHLGTSPASIRQIWTSEAANKGGINYGSYVSEAFDAAIDSAVNSLDPAKSEAFYTRAYQTAIDDAPAIWLYEPNLTLGVHKRIRTAPYRPDAWWYSLADWHIPQKEQIARDRIKY